ncbi:hypothetical protein B0T13DRAFT_202946 [Neurospora crassa]|nr:hypothetical protein B0T13DRAFT_202946 [Neurospora crassa]
MKLPARSVGWVPLNPRVPANVVVWATQEHRPGPQTTPPMPRVVLRAGLAKKNTNHIPTKLVSPFVGLIGADVVDGTFAVMPLHIELASRGEASYVLADGRKGCAKLPQTSSSDLLSTLQLGKHHAYAQIFKPQPSDRERRAEASSTNKPPQRAGQLQSGRMLPNQGCGEQNPNIKVHTSTYLFLYTTIKPLSAVGIALALHHNVCMYVRITIS